ncbi:MAG: glycosyltransferase family 2 protein [Ilumatobacter sp.]|nr:glycosyltransferase family 2 protein [Ilumatobacter sp.]
MSATRLPSVDIGIPCYDYGRYLADAVAHALDQDGVRVRILIVDDASTDDTESIGRTLAASDERVRYLRHPVNLGPTATFNDAVRWASAEYFALVSADDLLAPGALARAADVMERRPEVGLVYGEAVDFVDAPDRSSIGDPVVERFSNGEEWLTRRCVEATNTIRSPEAVVRTRVQHHVGGYEQSLPHTHDFHVWLKVAAVSDVVRLGGPVHAWYRVHGDNLSIRQIDGLETELRHRHAALSLFFAEGWVPESLGADLRQASGDRLAALAIDGANRLLDTSGSSTAADDLVAFAAEVGQPGRFACSMYGLRRRSGRWWHRSGAAISSRVVRRLRSEIAWRRWRRLPD